MSEIYVCPHCRLGFDMEADLISKLDIESPSGEPLLVSILTCPNCESLSIPEGLNEISWIVPSEAAELITPGSE